MLSDLRRLFAILLAVSCCLSTGEPPVPAEATNAFAAQGENATVPTVPSVVGLWIWSGRADAQYRPFFEWDLRLAAGMSALDGIKARLTTLGPDQEVLRQGGWISLDAIGAGSSRDVALRLNCPVFPAWKLELTWNGGHASWIGFDLASLPIPHSGSEDGSIVVAVGADADPIKGKKGAIATWYLWNLGNKPATQVTQIVRLRNQAGAVVATGELVMAKDEVLAAHASKPCRLVLPNAPAGDLPAEVVAAHLAARAARPAGQLRVLSLGRLDRQKGVERVWLALLEARRRGLPFEWRVIGGAVIEGGADARWRAAFARLGVAVEPPLQTDPALAEALGWADVLLLPSRWEGAPLTVLEAQRLGCVPIATAVGALSELIMPDQDGVLLPDGTDAIVAAALVAELAALSADRLRLARLAAASARRAAVMDWGRQAAPLVRLLDGWFPGRVIME